MVGIIPAYAGSTPPTGRRASRARDHPRVRGEHERTTSISQCLQGSSPRTRGARLALVLGGGYAGIIPAYAGSTTSDGATVGPTEDHPRVRGEHQHSESATFLVRGSSPRTRGARIAATRRRAWGRIIPAYAGSTACRVDCSRLQQDHPRVRGEHWARTAKRARVRGSSPRTRGARACGQAQLAAGRIIPAYAGSTGMRAGAACGGQDHPRVRGEHTIVNLFNF